MYLLDIVMNDFFPSYPPFSAMVQAVFLTTVSGCLPCTCPFCTGTFCFS